MKLTDYILDYLDRLDVNKTVFVITGGAIAELLDAFTRNDRLKYVCSVHEQAISFAVETMTKVTGKLSVAMVTSGPGGTNLLTGIANCWYDSIPCIFITGQVNSQFLSKNTPLRQVGFQELDIVSMSTPITKYAKMVTNPNDIKYVLDKAVFEATNGRPGPVLIDLPLDMQRQDVDPTKLIGFYGEREYFEGNVKVDNQIDQLLNKLEESERPILLGGGGIRLADAIEDAIELVDLLKIPCIPTWNALDIFPSDYKYYAGRVGTYGGPGRNFAIQNSDLLITIGSRISGRITGGYVDSFARKAFKVIVDIDEGALEKKYQQVIGDINIHCDAKVFIRKLIEQAKKRKLKTFDSWVSKAENWKTKYDPVLSYYHSNRGIVNPYVFIESLSKKCTKDDVIVADCGGNIVVTSQAFKTKTGQRLLSSNGNSPMGYSFAGAIGACCVNVKGNVICLIGDGGFTVNIQELQTVKNYNLPLKTFIMNNNVYGIVEAYQDTNLSGRHTATGPEGGYIPPNFLEVVKAYGIDTLQINDHADLEEKIDMVLNHKGSIVCDVNMKNYCKYEPRIFGWRTPIESMSPYLSREEFKENMIIDPLVGWESFVVNTFKSLRQ